MDRTWNGFYLDGKSASRHPVTIQIMRGALHVTTAVGKKFSWPYTNIRQTQGNYKGEQVRLEFGKDIAESLIIDDHQFLTALRQAAPDLTRHFHNPTKRTQRMKLTVLAAIGAIVVTAILYLWGIPGFAYVVTPFVPISWEERLGHMVVDQLAPVEKRCTDTKRLEPIKQVLTQLTGAAPDNPYTIHLYVVKHSLINAFAAPGGHVVVFSGLLEHTERPEQLAGVLAHELQHIYKRHTTRAIIQHTSSSLLLAAVAGDFSGAMTYGIEAARTIGMLQYSRGHEREADEEGIRLMARAGIDPAGMVEFFTILKKKYPDMPEQLKFLSSHPSTQDRIDSLKQFAQAAGPPTHALLPQVNWKEAREVCTQKGPASKAMDKNIAPGEKAP